MKKLIYLMFATLCCFLSINAFSLDYKWESALSNSTFANIAGYTGIQESDTLFYSSAMQGGNYNTGVIFEWDPTSNTYTKKIDLGGPNTPGKRIYGALTLFNGKFYGMTQMGGNYNKGVIFEWDPKNNQYVKKIDLDGSTMGSTPYGSLVLYNNKFYSMTYAGGAYDKGVIFEWDPVTNNFDKKIDFNGIDGANSQGTLVLYNDKFYGLTMYGGSNNVGVIFEWNPNTNTYLKKVDLSSATGNQPGGQLVMNNDVFYGMTSAGGNNNIGVIFEWNPNTNIFNKMHDFSNIDGANSDGSLFLKDGKLYGMTYAGGSFNHGTIFEFNLNGNVFTKKIDFNVTNGSEPISAYSFVLNGGIFLSTTTHGGSNNAGVIFKWDPSTTTNTVLYSFTGSGTTWPNGRNPMAEFSPYIISTPTVQASNIVFSDKQVNSVKIKWTNGNGDNRAVFVKKDSSGSALPVNRTTYSADSVFGNGSQIGNSGWYCVYNGNSDSVTVTNLVQDTNYRVMVCEYNGFHTHELYNSDTTNGNPLNTILINNNVALIQTSVSPIGGGITYGGGLYNIGDTATIVAVADTNYNFIHWTENGNIVSDSNSYTFIVTRNSHFIAYFQSKPQPVTISTSSYPIIGGLTIGSGIYFIGDTVTVSAIPDSAFVFVSWTENGILVSDTSTYEFIANSNRNLVANFDSAFYVMVGGLPSGGGTIIGSGYYIPGSIVTIKVKPNPGWEFYGWTKDCKLVSKDSVYTFEITENTNIMAHFYQIGISYTILAEASPTEGGYVTGGCNTYQNGVSVTLEAFPYDGWMFKNWVDDNNVVFSDSSKITVMNQSLHLIAKFALIFGIDNHNLQNIKIYPNPAKDILNIECEDNFNLKIVNSLSKVVYVDNIKTGKTTIGLNYIPGIYYVIMSNKDKTITNKIIVIN
jgi:uncharacterized repeat protein (TIGR03803 family)